MSRLPGLVLALALALPAAAEIAGQGETNPALGPLVDDLIFGIYCAEEPVGTEPAPETASGVINLHPGLPEMRLEQLVVPAVRDLGFGALIRLAPGETRDVTITVTHPPFPGSGIEVERWYTTFDSDDYGLNGFSFDREEEKVPGTWTFSAHAGEELIYHIEFEVVPAEALPDAASVCSGALIG
ncbi:DUF3859 domain-containing protein [Rhodobacterales bacterium HKCCE3408]|nr:DUF3859 domain-containing protein [Rhodobacterales bacterium HKCCE3408]